MGGPSLSEAPPSQPSLGSLRCVHARARYCATPHGMQACKHGMACRHGKAGRAAWTRGGRARARRQELRGTWRRVGVRGCGAQRPRTRSLGEKRRARVCVCACAGGCALGPALGCAVGGGAAGRLGMGAACRQPARLAAQMPPLAALIQVASPLRPPPTFFPIPTRA